MPTKGSVTGWLGQAQAGDVAAAQQLWQRYFGRMVALRGTKIVDVLLSEAVGTMRSLDPDFLNEAEEFFR